jgi:hypothetical protein
MRIDVSNFLLAAQAQTQRPSAIKAPAQTTAFEPLDFSASSTEETRRQPVQPGAVPRPGTQLDIKV